MTDPNRSFDVRRESVEPWIIAGKYGIRCGDFENGSIMK